VATVREKTSAETERFSSPEDLSGGKAPWWLGPKRAMLVMLILLAAAVLILAAVAGFSPEKVLWMYVELSKPTVMAV
jgi:hypothetical protein